MPESWGNLNPTVGSFRINELNGRFVETYSLRVFLLERPDQAIHFRASWLSSFSSQTAYRPMTIFWRYYDTSIFTSRRDGPEKLGSLVTLGPDFLKFCIEKNSVFQHQEIFSKNRQKFINFAGLRPAPPPYGAAPLPPTKVGAKCLAAVVLDNPEPGLSSQCPKSFTSSPGREAKKGFWGFIRTYKQTNIQTNKV